MPNKSNWKGRERMIARFFMGEGDGRRTPLSGGNSGITRSDTLCRELFVEQKQRVTHSVVSLWRKTKELAMREKKIPVVSLSEKNKKGFWLVIHTDDLLKICKVLIKNRRLDDEGSEAPQ